MTTGSAIAPSSAGGRTPAALACLALVGRLSGLPLSAEQLAADSGLPTGEIGLDTLALCAARAGFRCKATVLDHAARARVGRALPAIVRLRDGRTMVLTRVEDGEAPQATLIDPAGPGEAEPLVLERAAFEQAWGGDILLLRRAAAATERDRPLGWSLVGDLLRAEPRLVRDLALTTAALGVMALAQVLLARALIQDVSPGDAAATLLFLGCALGLVVAFEGAFTAVRQSLVTRLSVRVGLRLDMLAFDRLLRLPLAVFEATPRARIAQAMERVSAVQAGLAGAGARTVLDAVLALVLLPALLAISPGPGIAVVAVLGVAGGLALLLARRQRRAAAALAAAEVDRGVLLGETLDTVRTIKTAGLGARQRRRWDSLTARATRLRLAEAAASRSLDTLGHAADRLVLVGTVTLGAALGVTGMHAFAPADLFAVLLIAWRLGAPLRALPETVRAWSAARHGLAALAAVTEIAPEDARGRAGVTSALTGHIAFTHVTFSYPEAAAPALQAATFDAPAGSLLGIVGRSGAGKSTVVRLLQRLGGDYQGLIKIDGIDVREFDLDHLRASVAVVDQDSRLFPGTLRDNLALGRTDLSDDALLDALRLVGAEAMVDRLPAGLETVLSEVDARLSDGQRQRLAIARAVLADPAILVLDEATAALDPGSEAEIIAALRRRAGRTLVVVAQRLSVLVQADAILVLDRAEIQDIGRHQDLLERSDLYSGRWRREITGLAPALASDTAGADRPRLTRDAHVA